jgi:hypothetical protein
MTGLAYSCARREWPRRRCAAEKRDELATSHAEPSRRVPQSGISLARRIAWDMWCAFFRDCRAGCLIFATLQNSLLDALIEHGFSIWMLRISYK